MPNTPPPNPYASLADAMGAVGGRLDPALLQRAMQSLGVQGPAMPTAVPEWYRAQAEADAAGGHMTGMESFQRYAQAQALKQYLSSGGANIGGHLMGELSSALGIQPPAGGGPGAGAGGGGGAWRNAANINFGGVTAEQLRNDPSLQARLNDRQRQRFDRYNTATRYQPGAGTDAGAPPADQTGSYAPPTPPATKPTQPAATQPASSGQFGGKGMSRAAGYGGVDDGSGRVTLRDLRRGRKGSVPGYGSGAI